MSVVRMYREGRDQLVQGQQAVQDFAAAMPRRLNRLKQKIKKNLSCSTWLDDTDAEGNLFGRNVQFGNSIVDWKNSVLITPLRTSTCPGEEEDYRDREESLPSFRMENASTNRYISPSRRQLECTCGKITPAVETTFAPTRIITPQSKPLQSEKIRDREESVHTAYITPSIKFQANNESVTKELPGFKLYSDGKHFFTESVKAEIDIGSEHALHAKEERADTEDDEMVSPNQPRTEVWPMRENKNYEVAGPFVQEAQEMIQVVPLGEHQRRVFSTNKKLCPCDGGLMWRRVTGRNAMDLIQIAPSTGLPAPPPLHPNLG